MRAGYRLTLAARSDLNGIWNYTVRVWDASQAEHCILAIRNACLALAEGRKHRRPIDDIRPGYRKLAVGSHVLFYRTADTGEIDVIRILHQRMDVESRLSED